MAPKRGKDNYRIGTGKVNVAAASTQARLQHLVEGRRRNRFKEREGWKAREELRER